MIPLLPPGLIFHSSSSSKSRYLSLVMMSTGSLAPSIVFSSPFSTFHTSVGNASRPYPRHASVDLPSNSVFHGPGAAASGESDVSAATTPSKEARPMRDIGLFSMSAQANARFHGGQAWHSRVMAL